MVLHVVKHYLKIKENGWSYLYFSLGLSTGNKVPLAQITVQVMRGLCDVNNT